MASISSYTEVRGDSDVFVGILSSEWLYYPNVLQYVKYSKL